MAVSYEHHKKTPGDIKGSKFLEQLGDWPCVKNKSAVWSQLISEIRVSQYAMHNVTGKFFISSFVNDAISNWQLWQWVVDEENISWPSFIHFLNTNVFSVQETCHKWSCGLQDLVVLTPIKSIFSTYWMEDTFYFLRYDKNGLMLQ
jgi:hypothetical protein